VVTLGCAGVGKTALVERFLYDRFNPRTQATIGSAFGSKTAGLPPGGNRGAAGDAPVPPSVIMPACTAAAGRGAAELSSWICRGACMLMRAGEAGTVGHCRRGALRVYLHAVLPGGPRGPAVRRCDEPLARACAHEHLHAHAQQLLQLLHPLHPHSGCCRRPVPLHRHTLSSCARARARSACAFSVWSSCWQAGRCLTRPPARPPAIPQVLFWAEELRLGASDCMLFLVGTKWDALAAKPETQAVSMRARGALPVLAPLP
jgi:hypothetical protein